MFKSLYFSKFQAKTDVFLYFTLICTLEMMDSIICFKIINKQCISRSKSDERVSIVSYVNAVHIYNSSHASEKTATKHAPRTFTEIGRLCRIAWNERKDLIQLL